MRIVVTGGRSYTNAARLGEALDAIQSITHLSYGAATGADSLAAAWAKRNGIPATPYPADWDDIDHPDARIRWSPARRKFYDANAGRRRNRAMLEAAQPDLVVAFPGGPGTAHCVACALRMGFAVITVDD